MVRRLAIVDVAPSTRIFNLAASKAHLKEQIFEEFEIKKEKTIMIKTTFFISCLAACSSAITLRQTENSAEVILA